MPAFALLKGPGRYVACSWDLTQDSAGRTHWVEFFKRHIGTLLKLGTESAIARGADEESVRGRASACREEFCALFDRYAEHPGDFGRVTILTLDEWRDNCLREFGFIDPFVDLKQRENEKMLPLLRKVCREIDALSGAEQVRAIIEGVFAGNIFDMGAEATAKAFLEGGPSFHDVRGKLKARPWRIDDYNALCAYLLTGSLRKTVFFIDNAGSDFLLGALPMMRWLSQRGCEVVLAANERPTLNDMTIHDVRAWWPRIVEAEPSFADLPIHAVSTGTGEPLIDLANVSDELNRAARGADLVILEGMGRGVESNLDAEFSCRALNIAMVKDLAVAGRIEGELYDLVCRFR